jgi:hypothetical protein
MIPTVMVQHTAMLVKMTFQIGTVHTKPLL